MSIITSNQFWPEINKLIKLPDNVTNCSIQLDINEPVKVKVTYYPDMEVTDRILTKTFELIESKQAERTRIN